MRDISILSVIVPYKIDIAANNRADVGSTMIKSMSNFVNIAGTV
jgi:hypothetical protein